MMRPTVAIIGGGVAGMAAAYYLAERARSDPLDVLLFEAGPRLGGVLETRQRDGFLIETAADSFLTTPPAAVELCRELGLANELLAPNPVHRKALVVHNGRLEPIPDGFAVMAPSRLGALLRTPVLSTRGKLRAALEWFVPPQRSNSDESMESFVCRRFGRELFERLAQPLVGGIYTADPQRLSVDATMPRFRQMEREHGSLLRAMLRERRRGPHEKGGGIRYGQFASLRGGMATWIERLAARLPAGCVHLNAPVAEVAARGGGWQLEIGGPEPQSLGVDGLILAVPAFRSARLLAGVDGTLASELGRIPYASCAVVSLGYRREQIENPLDGFGFVVPLIEERLILSCSYSSVKYEGRAPEGTVLLRVFVGGACQGGLLQLPRQQLVELAEREIADLLHIRGEPIMRDIALRRQAMPQYHVGHRARVQRIAARLQSLPTLLVAGSALHGVGVPGCIQSGKDAANKLAAHLVDHAPFRAAPLAASPTVERKAPFHRVPQLQDSMEASRHGH